jgi:L-lysine 6-transaminase
MCAIEFPAGPVRDAVQEKAYELGMMILACGPASLRFRPPLDTTVAEIDEALGILKQAVEATSKKS